MRFGRTAGWFALWVLSVLLLLVAPASPAQARADDASPARAPGLSIQDMLVNPDRPQMVANQVIVTFKPGTSAGRAQQVAQGYGASVQKELKLASKVSGRRMAVVHSKTLSPAKLAEKLRNDPTVAMVSYNYERSITALLPNDPRLSELWGLDNTGQNGGTPDADIDAPEAWDVSTGSPDVVVADIDTGVDYTHSDLAANMWVNAGEIPGNGVDDDANGYVDDQYGIDTANGDSDPMDDHGHGTHTSGTIAAVGDNGIGVAGVGWSTKIMALKFLSGDGYGSDSGAIEAIYYALDQKLNRGVNVVAINASWGGAGYNPILEDVIAQAGAAGIVFVAAAGNWGVDTDATPHYPSGYDLPNIVSVGATDRVDAPAGFSNHGAQSVDLFAPGVGILSTLPGAVYVPGAGDHFFDGMEAGGTSWSAEGNASWSITTELPYEGSLSWSDSPGGDYLDNTDGFIVTQAIDLTAAPDVPVFGFQTSYDLEPGFDYLYVDFSGDDGVSWTTTAGLTGSSSWGVVAVKIPEHLRTAQFRARLHLITDVSVTSDGVYIDNVGIGSDAGGGVYEAWSGTSMATPHVAGAIGLIAAQYPSDDLITLIGRIRSGVDVLPQLAGAAVTAGRLNLSNSIDPALVLRPWVTDVTPRSGVSAGTTLAVQGHWFGDSPGRIILSDGGTEVDAAVVSWSDQSVEATMPGTANGTVILETAGGYRAVAGSVSAWRNDEPSIYSRDGNAAAVAGGKIYSFGGYTQGGSQATDLAEYYDPATSTWVTTSRLRLPGPRAYAAAAELGGRVHVIGGLDDTVFDFIYPKVVDDVEAYDPADGTWDSLPPLPTPLVWHEAVALDGKIYVFGGVNTEFITNVDMFVYDSVLGAWSTHVGPSIPRYEGAGIVLDGKIYLMGGHSDLGYLASAEAYDPVTDLWSPAPDLPFPLARMGVSVYGGLAYLVGGTNSDWWYGGTDTVLRFDPATREWQDLSPTIRALPDGTGVHSSPAAAIPGKGIYSLNGMARAVSTDRLLLLPAEALDTLTIFGQVLGGDGAPIVDATVEAWGGGIVVGSAQTGAQGDYEIDAVGLQLGDIVDVAASAPGYAPVTQHGVFDESQEEVSFLDFRDVGYDRGDRRLPLLDADPPPTLIFDELMPEPLTVTATAGTNGSVEPATQDVRYGGDVSIEITPDPGYRIGQITVDGVPAPIADPFVLRDVRADRAIHATFTNAVNQVAVTQGWNLLAGAPGSDTHGVALFAYSGNYHSITAAQMELGRGYWGRFPGTDTLSLNASGMPIPVHLTTGWNLIGNSGNAPASLPHEMSGFVFSSGSYTSTSVLAPGQGAWVKSLIEQDIVLIE